MAEPIRIIITQGGQGGQPFEGDVVRTRSQQQITNNKNDIEEATIGSIAQSMLINAAWSNTKRVISFSISNYSNLTQDYFTQRNIDEALAIGQELVNVGLSTLSGFKLGMSVGHPIAGAAVGFAVGVAGVGVGHVLDRTSYSTISINTNAQVNMYRALSGNYGGSRNTNE